MLVCYAFEERSPWFILAFALACALASTYGFLQGAINRSERRQQMMELTISVPENVLVLAGENFERRYQPQDGVTIAEVLPALPMAFLANSVATSPGITSETWISGYFAARSTRTFAVNTLSAALAAL